MKQALEVIGELTVTDNSGHTRTVKIRREDVTTTNGAFRAIRDEVADALRETLESNREVGA